MSLRQKVVRAGGWTITGFVASQVMRLGGNLVLTRLLFPEAFGLMSVVYVLMTGLVLLSDFGINQSIIQNRRGDDPLFLNTAWVVQILRGGVITVFIVFLSLAIPAMVGAGWIPENSVYADPMLPWVLVVFSSTAIFQGFESTRIALARRRVLLKRVTQLELFSQLVALVVMLLSAWLYRSLWALVAGAVVAAALRCLLSHVWLEGPPSRWQWDRDVFREIFHFGKWIFLASILGFLWMNGDRLILGGMLSAGLMGVYSVAYLLSNAVMMLYSSIIARVLFPAFSEVVNTRPENIPGVYRRIQFIADAGLFAVAGFLFSAAPSIVGILYDVRYHEAGEMLSVRALTLVGARYAVVEFLCLAKANTRILVVSNLVRLVVLYVCMPIAYSQFGMEGALYAIVFSYFAAWPFAWMYKAKHGLAHWLDEFAPIPMFILAYYAGKLFSGGVGV